MSRVMTGARAIFRINGTKVALASQCSFSESIQLEAVNVLDKLEVEEYAEVGYTVDLQCQAFRIQSQSVKQLGIMPKLNAILTSGEMTAEIVDRVTNSVILLMEGVKMESRQSTVDARGVMTETWSFKGIKSSDESGG